MSNLRSTKRVRVDRHAVEEAAAEIVNRRGLASLSMSELASALDVKAPSLYAHVAGIDEVRRMLALRGLGEIENTLARAALGKAGAEAVRAMLVAHLEYVRSNPGVYEATIPSPPRGDREWTDAADKVQATTMAVLSAFGFSEEDEIRIQRGLRSLAHGFAALEGSGAFRSSVDDRDESFGWLVDVFLAGLPSTIATKATGTTKTAIAATTRATRKSVGASGRKAART
jgi:AcrR family transcriptional regulator